MNILFQRRQKTSSFFQLFPLRIGPGVTFSLNAEFELSSEELSLIRKYRMTKAAIVRSEFTEDIRRALRPAVIIAIIALAIAFLIFSWQQALSVFVLVLLVMTSIYYFELRESIKVDDLLDGGRRWRCDSLVSLVEREAFLEQVAAYLRQVLESAKHWDDREVIPIEPLSKDDAKRAILKARRG